MISVKEYPKFRLGKLYFPTYSNEVAKKKLLFLIATHPELKAELFAIQPNPVAKKFSAAEVKLILSHLGQPPYGEDSADDIPAAGL